MPQSSRTVDVNSFSIGPAMGNHPIHPIQNIRIDRSTAFKIKYSDYSAHDQNPNTSLRTASTHTNNQAHLSGSFSLDPIYNFKFHVCI